jgi:hypothetical protein
MGHIVGKDDVRVDPKKIEAIQEWPRPETLKIFFGFLGLTGYYHKFVKNYGKIVDSLTTLLKKNVFSWAPTIDHSLQGLKVTMCTTQVQALPYFNKTFVLECDASGKGTGVFLMQDGRDLAFTRKQVSERHLCQSTYEKEMLVILHIMDL